MIRLGIKTTKTSELIDITAMVEKAVGESGTLGGVAIIYCPHTTAGITINENADPAVAKDIVMKTSKVFERSDPEFTHMEGNSDGHIKSSLFGASETILIDEGRLVLGTWQAVYFAEFDGPRSRNFFVKILGD